MRLSSLVLLLPAAVAAQEQVPLKDQLSGWLNKAKSFLPTAPAAPVESVASTASNVKNKVLPQKQVVPFTLSNWEANLAPVSAGPADGTEDWLVFITGGNKTCFGRCGLAEKSFNESVALFSADPTSPNLGYINCENERILCSIWGASAPSVWYYNIPVVQEGEVAATPLHVVYLNTTTVTPETIYKIHSEKTYEKVPAYEGIFHPLDGTLAQYKLNVPVGYALWGLNVVPSWLFMIGISFFSRTIMSRRVGPQGGQPRRPGAGDATS